MGQSMKKLQTLKEAIEEGEVSLPAIGRLLDSGLSVNASIGHMTALYYAVSKRQTEVVEFLLEHGASVHSGYFTETPLHHAAVVGELGIVSALLDKGAAVNKRNHNGCTPLWYAVQGSHLRVAERLLQCADVDVDCPCGDTFLKSTSHTSCLSLAVQNQHSAMVRLLLDKGADRNMADVSGCTPLHHACRLGNASLAQLLVHSGCELDVADTYGYTPVHRAVCQDAASIVTLLVNAGCDVNLQRMGDMCHPLHSAADRGNPDVVAALCMAQNVDVNCRDRSLRTPLIMACRSGNVECAKHLLGSGADANVLDSNGLSVLSLALCLEEAPCMLWRLSGLGKSRSCYNVHKEDGPSDGCQGNTSVTDAVDSARGSTHHEINSTIGSSQRSSFHNWNNEGGDCHDDKPAAEDDTISDTVSCQGGSKVSVCGRSSSLDVLQVLIQGGAELDLQDAYGKTAMDYSLRLLKLHSSCLLLCHGASINTEHLLAALSHARAIRFPPVKFVRPAVEALTLTSFEIRNYLHHIFYKSSCCDDESALFSIMEDLQQPMTLASMSRLVIRRVLGEKTSKSIASLISGLPLPISMKRYLLMSDVLEIVCNSKVESK